MDLSDPGPLSQIAHGLQLAVGIVFLAAAVSKARHSERFIAVVSDYRIGPAQLARPIALVVMVAEFCVAMSLLTGLVIEAGLALALAALMTFGVAVAVNLVRGRSIRCGCFGDTEPISSTALIRIALLLMSVLLLASMRIANLELLSAHGLVRQGAEGGVHLLQAGLLAISAVMIALWMLHASKVVSVARRRTLSEVQQVPRSAMNSEEVR